MDQSEKHRRFYARLICTAAKLDDPRIEEAFRTVRREPFAGPGPWWMIIGGHAYVQTPDDDPAFRPGTPAWRDMIAQPSEHGPALAFIGSDAPRRRHD
ncbi:hypothetical protein BRAO375_1050015 [Bradyrhizobium sp. ORS 375]|uniref:hypothetical protein n=1 Tax=Bradyrhizobium sp. (strain ORS 375) TaxID=566679 RepID=UPI000240A102|nr:hypothetical protein [Bradyrhizobium sp. ORS 375]CCD90516.1 hypothetical protein BRAO375_1050015 [Bradyrhizobium sp. ORS 375]